MGCILYLRLYQVNFFHAPLPPVMNTVKSGIYSVPSTQPCPCTVFPGVRCQYGDMYIVQLHQKQTLRWYRPNYPILYGQKQTLQYITTYSVNMHCKKIEYIYIYLYIYYILQCMTHASRKGQKRYTKQVFAYGNLDKFICLGNQDLWIIVFNTHKSSWKSGKFCSSGLNKSFV